MRHAFQDDYICDSNYLVQVKTNTTFSSSSALLTTSGSLGRIVSSSVITGTIRTSGTTLWVVR
jgi:hypothetical protein